MDQVAQIRERIDIVSFISEYIPLKRAGRNFNTQCPFHNEKTPSFVVSPERQMFHCFGCGKGGDIFTFLIEYENLEFIEALRTLAKRAGVELIESVGNRNNSSKKEIIYALNALACEYYQYVLQNHPVGKNALEYLEKERKLNSGIIKTFKLGYSPSSGTALSTYLIEKKKYHREDIIESGLSFLRNGRLVDFFINRVMFPLTDHRGNIVGFSGRVMGDAQVAKYVNTRETLVYHKGSVFFGLDTAKDSIKKEDKAIIVEGEFDVISCFENSIKNVVAVKGTALTENQVSLISRFTQKVALCFDQDKAGREAIKRSLTTLEKKGITTTVIIPSGGKDADEALKKDPHGFKKAVSQDIGVYDYLLERSLEDYSSQTVNSKQRIAEELLPIFAGIENEIVKEHYLRKLSKELDTSYESIIRQIEKIHKKAANTIEAVVIKKEKRERQDTLEEYLIALLLLHPSSHVVLPKMVHLLNGYSFNTQAYQKIIDILKKYYSLHTTFNQLEFIKMLPAELHKSFDTCFLFPIPEFSTEKDHTDELEKVSKDLRVIYIRSKIKEISDSIKKKEKEGNMEDIEQLQQELMNFTSLLKTIPENKL